MQQSMVPTERIGPNPSLPRMRCVVRVTYLITLLLTFSSIKQKLHHDAVRQLNEIVGVELEVVPALSKRPINIIIIIILA